MKPDAEGPAASAIIVTKRIAMARRGFVVLHCAVAADRGCGFPLIELQRPEIVEVHDPLNPAACSDNDERGDLLLLHESERR